MAQFISFGGAGSCLIICGFMTSVTAALFFLVLSLFLFGAHQCALSCAFLDVTPNYSTALNSLANLFGAIAGILTACGFTVL